ncbi:MAG: hypothetical protein C4323_20980 [Mastigocladus sp. ERB_26_2]
MNNLGDREKFSQLCQGLGVKCILIELPQGLMRSLLHLVAAILLYIEILEILAAPQWWNSSKNRSKWKWYTRKVPTQIMPEDFLVIVDVAIGRWKSVVETLLPLSRVNRACGCRFLI